MIREGLHEVSVFSVRCKIFRPTSGADLVVKRPDQLPLELLVSWGGENNRMAKQTMSVWSVEGQRNSRSQSRSTKDENETSNHFLCRAHCLRHDSHSFSSTKPTAAQVRTNRMQHRREK